MSGDLLKPAPPTQIHSPGAPLHSGKMLPNDLDSSLANLVGSEYPGSFLLVPPRFPFAFLAADVVFLLLSDLQFGGTPAKK